MRRIAGPGNVANRFADYDPIANPNGTVYTADYGNDVQDELIGIQDMMGVSESVGSNTYVAAAIVGMTIRYGHAVGDTIARSGNVAAPAAFDPTVPTAFHPRFCLTDFAGARTLDQSNWPDLVPWLRQQRVIYLEGQTGEVVDFSGTVSGSTLTLDDTPAANALLAALVEDQLAFGSFTDWRSVDVGDITYEITAIDAAVRAITVAGTPAAGSVNATLYPHRIAGSSSTARMHSWRGRSPVGAGTDQVIGGLMRRDRFQGHWHTVKRQGTDGELRFGNEFGSGSDGLGSGVNVAGNASYEARDIVPDDENDDPRTGPDTHGPDVGVHLYLHAGRYVD